MKHLVVPAVLGALLLGFGILLYETVDSPFTAFEKQTLNPGFRSAANPGDLLVPFSHLPIDSDGRMLDGFVVYPDRICQPQAAVLLFHGRGQTIADWTKVQKRLRDSCIASVVFDYSGHGHSAPGGTVAHLDADALAAWEHFAKMFPPGMPRCMLGHSLGNAPMLYALAHASIAPDCVIMASPFASLRAMAVADGLPRLLDFVMPDAWNNVAAVSQVETPLLWIHSRSDSTVPIAQGQAVFDAKPGPKTALMLDGLDHNAIYETVPNAIWGPVAGFIHGAKGS